MYPVRRPLTPVVPAGDLVAGAGGGHGDADHGRQQVGGVLAIQLVVLLWPAVPARPVDVVEARLPCVYHHRATSEHGGGRAQGEEGGKKKKRKEVMKLLRELVA